MLPQAILFDMDDTLLFVNVTADSAWKEACNLAVKEPKPHSTEEFLNQLNTVRNWYWSDAERHRVGRLDLHGARTAIIRMALEKLGCNDEQTANNIAANYANILDGALEFFPNAENTLKELVKKRVKLALLTNGAGEAQRAKIQRFKLGRYFSICLIEGELGYGKPDQRFFKMALDKLGVMPNQAWMVGDDLERDITGAQAAEIFSVWYDFREAGLPASSTVKPDRIINNLAELLK
jgi:putative hydrolase of the HAD superfamily